MQELRSIGRSGATEYAQGPGQCIVLEQGPGQWQWHTGTWAGAVHRTGTWTGAVAASYWNMGRGSGSVVLEGTFSVDCGITCIATLRKFLKRPRACAFVVYLGCCT